MTWLMVVLMLALSSPAFGQMATTTATSTLPYSSTAEEYREQVIRAAAQGASHTPGWPFVALPAVDDISDAGFFWIRNPTEPVTYTLGLRELTLLHACHAQPPFGTNFWYNLRLSCAQLRLPPAGATVNRSQLPESYNQYGEPPSATPPPARRPTTPEPEPEAPQEPVGNLEVPGNGSFQSGIGYVSGWVCEAERVAIVIDGGLHLPPVARNISRGDTEAICGDQDNGFILHWNYNLMGDGTYTAALVVDGQTIQSNTFTVTTLGEEFIKGLERDVVVNDFPGPGENTRLRWQEPAQGFVLVPGSTD